LDFACVGFVGFRGSVGSEFRAKLQFVGLILNGNVDQM
jgi:hypothetical protein